MAAPAIDIERLVKHYGKVRALRGIDLRVEPGEIFGFLGPNGAGKSTTLRILLDLIRPTAGRAAVFGHDCQADSVAARRMMGYLPSEPVFPPRMTALEVFEYAAAIRGDRIDEPYRDALIERLRLDAARKVSTLSRGNRQKVGLVQALLPKPPLVILDEPTTGLDPLMQEEVERILREVAGDGRTVFFSSHILEEVEHICSRAAIVRDGLIVDVFALAEQRRLAPVHVEVTFAEPVAKAAFDGLPAGVHLLSIDGRSATFEVRDGIDPLVKRLAGHTVEHLVARETTLEEMFIRHYQFEEREEVTP
jgi:ABC-2 type transport system ATP-binding protein